jgi:hypothetical protein
MIQVGHAIWQRAERCGLIQGSVQSGRLPADVGRKTAGIGEGGTSEQRRVDARLREDAGLLRICRREGKGPPAANGRRRPFALVNQVSGRARE